MVASNVGYQALGGHEFGHRRTEFSIFGKGNHKGLDQTLAAPHCTPSSIYKTYQAWTSEGFPQLDLESEDGLMRKLFFRCRVKTTDRIATMQIPSTATKINASPMVLGRPRTRGGAIVTCNVAVAVSCPWSVTVTVTR